jgi:hypothetical protein
VYQFINFLTFHIFEATAQPSKPFLFLGGATLCVGCVYALHGVQEFIAQHKKFPPRFLVAGKMLLVILLLLPLTLFTNNPDVRAQLNDAKNTPKGEYLASVIQDTVKDYEDRTWLSSGIPEINAFIPLKYYIAHNAHFSHQASLFSKRLYAVKNLVRSETAYEFNTQAELLGIDALLLYTAEDDSISLYFWVDNFPNGGTTLSIPFTTKVIDTTWNKVYSDDEWEIYIQ